MWNAPPVGGYANAVADADNNGFVVYYQMTPNPSYKAQWAGSSVRLLRFNIKSFFSLFLPTAD